MASTMLASIKNALRVPMQKLSSCYNTVFNSHEQYGIINMYRTTVLCYASLYFYVKSRGARKNKEIKAAKVSQKEAILNDALTRSGLSS
uniref:Uncharacterized protein n=1 Tax=Ditylenchus dipsaci TaxID=166011 RepID=A0A915E5I9_9BILA